MKHIDLTGQKFGMLTVVRRAASENGATRWWCGCDCGNLTTVAYSGLKSNTISCGCQRKKDRDRYNERNAKSRIVYMRTWIAGNREQRAKKAAAEAFK
jgi:hypothetical protein